MHCKAGKGRTGMMISSLLVFLQLADSTKTAIAHYDKKRAKEGTHALTIASQKRFVRFFEGFLNYKLLEGLPWNHKLRNASYFEQTLRRWNFMIHNDVEDDMRSETLDIYGMCFGPFPTWYKDYDIKLVRVNKDNK